MPKPFLTPEFTSETWQCRTLRTPDNKEWLGVFSSALLEMLNPYNWEQVETADVSVDDAIAIVEGILIEYFATETCLTGCALPDTDGTPPFRLGVDGGYEMLDPATGEWGEPNGEYEIPPTPAREEATAAERKCLAAANAAHVMFLLYEAITDEIALGGDTLQVAAALVAAAVTAIGGWIAAPLYAVIQLTIALFAGMIELLQVLGADVWTAEFNDKLMCALLACATDTGDVVTFDLECIRAELAVEPDIFNPTIFYEYQLYAQVLFLMETITMDGLNAAGATTAITTETCDTCDVEWCYTFDFTTGQHGWVVPSAYAAQTHYVASQGFKPITYGIIAIRLVFPETIFVRSIGLEWSTAMTGNYKRMFYKWDGAIASGGATEVNVGTATDWGIMDVNADHTTIELLLQNGTPNTSYPLNFAIDKVVINGTGGTITPFGDDNCV